MEKKKGFFSGITDFKDVDFIVFLPVLIVFLIFVVWGLVAPDSMSGAMGGALNWFTHKLGAIILILTFAFFLFEIFIAVSKYGSIRIGADDDKPEHSFFNWFAMLFAACYGVGITFWGASEPLSFVAGPVFNLEPYSSDAAIMGLAAAYNHWGPLPWSYTLIAAMAIGYWVYRRNMPPRFSLGLYPLFGEKHYGNWLCRLIDGIQVVAAMCAGTTMFGFAINQFLYGLGVMAGVENTAVTRVIVLALSVGLFTWSCLSGVKKGIAFLSRINIYVAVGLMVFIWGIGSPVFDLDLGTHAFGQYMDNFFGLNFNTDPIEQSGFPQGWTIFYWAWWIASAGQIGLFVASISKGRTIREMVVGILVVAPLSTFIWFAVWGGGAIYQQYFGGHDLVGKVMSDGAQGGAWAYLQTLPFFKITSVVFLILGFVFLVTSGDSGVFSWSQATMKRDYNHIEPAKSIRLTYCLIWFIIGAILLVNVGTSMSAIQSGGVAVSIPCFVIFTGYCVAFWKAIKNDTPVTRAELDKQAVEVGRNVNEGDDDL